jgi:class 3 adenylate cyclase/tetratricopeptide (TPR) repeat protein
MSSVEIPDGTVTVLFTDVVGSTELNQRLGDVEARDLVRGLEHLVHEAVARNRGVHIKGLGDGVMVAFASARRAVACAREIQRGVAERNRQHGGPPVEMRIGLHTGEVIAEDGDLHGETVVIAKRIEGVARPGSILASGTVHGVLGTARDELIDAGEHELKGITSGWRLFEVPWKLHRHDGSGDRTPFVGREAERQQVRMLVHRTAAGHGALLVVSGDAGVGKSRLVAEAMAEAASVGAAVLTGQCLDMQSPPPFQPVIDQIDAASRALTRERFLEVLGENAAEVATLMPALRQRYDGFPEPPPLPPDQERHYVLHGVADFIERATVARPLILLFEDLHWADESTLVLLQTLAPRLTDLALLVVVTHRPVTTARQSPLAAALPALLRQDATVELPLAPLDASQVATFLERLAGVPAPGPVVDMVVSETDGNPYFVEELYRHLVERERLFSEAGGWRTDVEIAETEVPKGVLLLVGQRLDDLELDHRRPLAVAAAIGRSFTFDLLQEVAAADDDELFDALEAAERLHLVEDATVGRDASYRFTHELVRQTLLGDLSVARRQRLHLRVAKALGAQAVTGGGAGPTVEISHHYHLAGAAADDAEAGAAHLAAAETALGAVAFEDALAQLELAMSRLTDQSEPQARALAMRARCLQGLARIDDALAALREALALLEPAAETAFDIRRQLVTLLLDLFRGAEAFEEVAALAEHPRTAHPSDQLEVLLLTARSHYILALDDGAHADPARDCYERAHVLAVELGDHRRAARALLATVWFADHLTGYGRTAAENVREAARLAAEIDDIDLDLDVAIAGFQVRAHDDPDAEARRLLERLEERRDPLRLKEHCFTLMWFHFGRGHFADGVAVCDRGIALAEQLGVPPVMYGSIKALSLTEMGRYDQVGKAIAQEVTTDADPFGQAMAAVARTYFLARIGAWEPAIELGVPTYRRLGDLLRARMQLLPRRAVMVAAAHLGIPDPLVGEPGPDEDAVARSAARDVAAELALIRDDAEAALDLAAKQAEWLAGRGRDGELAWTLLVRAEAALRLGDASAADLATQGLELAEANGQGSVIWQLRAVLGRALLADGQEGPAESARSRARRELDALADQILEPDLRRWFDAHPRAALLG